MVQGGGVQPDGIQKLALLGIPSAAVLGFTLQPVIAIADPIALLVTGLLVALSVLGLLFAVFAESITAAEGKFWGLVLIAAAISVVITVGSAWWEQRKANAICSNLQQVMLFEHRVRKDVPEIFRSLGCKIQT